MRDGGSVPIQPAAGRCEIRPTASPVDGEMVNGSKLVLVGGLGIDPQGVDAGVGAGLGDGEPAES